MKNDDYKELIDAFIFEALKDTPFDYYYDYKCSASDAILLHGNIDFLIYHKAHELPLIPVVKVRKAYNRFLDMEEDYWNTAEAIGVNFFFLCK